MAAEDAVGVAVRTNPDAGGAVIVDDDASRVGREAVALAGREGERGDGWGQEVRGVDGCC